MTSPVRFIPALDWARRYTRSDFAGDSVAAVVVTIMLIPQSLAYALLAGLPPEAGLYASIVPVLLYALLGTSRALAVGPVAVVSLLTASALGEVAATGTAGYAAAALVLAALSGGFLLLLGLFRLGGLANFLSHPVIAGFITASGLLIALGQLRNILGIDTEGHTAWEIAGGLAAHLDQLNPWTLLVGASATGFLFWVRKGFRPVLRRLGVSDALADGLVKAGPVLAVVATTAAAWAFGLSDKGVSIVGSVPQGLPPFTWPGLDLDLIRALVVPAVMISIIGFVESVSVAETLAARSGDRIDPNQELIGLGAANIGAALTGGFPVTGGFSRSVVNYDAGAATPAAGAMAALGLMLAALLLTPLVYYLPKATLAATILVAVLSLVDFSILRRTWDYDRADFIAVAGTIVVTLGFGVEAGVATGVLVSLGLHLRATARPHVAEVGRVPGSEHFRNVMRHTVETDPCLLALRIDESLTFVNARFLDDMIRTRIESRPEITQVILVGAAINRIDYSALETLDALNGWLARRGVKLHLSEVKGPVMDALENSHFLSSLTGSVFLSQNDAWETLRTPSQLPAVHKSEGHQP